MSIKQFLDDLLHPSDDVLGEYEFDLLAPDEAQEITQHLATCAHCAQRLAAWRAYAAKLEPEFATLQAPAPAPAESFSHWVAQLLGGSISDGGYAMDVRGGHAQLRGEAPLQKYEAGPFRLALRDQSTRGAQSMQLLGQLTPNEPIAITDLDICLWNHGTTDAVASTTLEEDDTFLFTDFPPGRYDLTISAPTWDVQITDLTLPFAQP